MRGVSKFDVLAIPQLLDEILQNVESLSEAQTKGVALLKKLVYFDGPNVRETEQLLLFGLAYLKAGLNADAFGEFRKARALWPTERIQ